MHGLREYVEAGGLMSYGVNWPELVDKVLRVPANIPIEQPTKLRASVQISDKLLALADEVDRMKRREFTRH